MGVNIIIFLIPLISIILVINMVIAKIIFNELKTLDKYFLIFKEGSFKEGSFNKYYYYGIIYLFRINEQIEYEKYNYYKSYLSNIYVKMSPIHKPIESIREFKQKIVLYERKIKLNKIKKRVKFNKVKII